MPVFSSVKGNGAMRSRILAKIVTTVLIASCQPSEPDVSYTPQFEVVEAPGDFPVTVPSSFESTLGWLVVPEDRADTTSKLIRLPVAIVHSKAEEKKSPVIYLAGGPGTAAMNTAAYPGAYPWLSNRDLIVIGQPSASRTSRRTAHQNNRTMASTVFKFTKTYAGGKD